MENALCPKVLDRFFGGVAQEQYTRDLLFSALVNLMAMVVFKVRPSVQATSWGIGPRSTPPGPTDPNRLQEQVATRFGGWWSFLFRSLPLH